VAPYQWVPQPAWFQSAIGAAWQSIHPEITLNWCVYDCYHDDPPATLDVFAFDTIFARYFINQQYLQAFPVMDLGDFLPWSLTGLTINSEWVWAVPNLGCLNTLIYRAGDPQLAAPGLTNAALLGILGVSPATSPEPPPGSGLLVDFTGGTTDACMYLQTTMENSGSYPIDPPLPPWTNLDAAALKDLRQLVSMAGLQQASYVDPNSVRLDWFMAGRGRALVGLTETLGFLTNSEISGLAFRPLPIADMPVGTIPLFADAWGVNAAIDPRKVGVATDFATMAASTQVMLAALLPPTPAQTPQCLTPVRTSVLTKLASAFPVYSTIQTLVGGPATAAFRIGSGSRTWLAMNAAGIRNQILGTDFVFDEATLPLEYPSTPAGIWRRG